MSIVACRSHRGLLPSRTTTEKVFHYIGGTTGPWTITNVDTAIGSPLKPASKVTVSVGELKTQPIHSSWILRGFANSTRFITRDEVAARVPNSDSRDDSESLCAALILIRRSKEWWNLENDERAEIQNERENRIRPRMPFFTMVAKRLHLHRDKNEAFDFLAWIECYSDDVAVLDEIASTIRGSHEPNYVDRQIDIRLVREEP